MQVHAIEACSISFLKPLFLPLHPLNYLQEQGGQLMNKNAKERLGEFLTALTMMADLDQ